MHDYQLVGFISDLTGNEGQLFTADPVLRHGDQLFVAEAQSWTPENVRRVSESRMRFVEQIPLEEQRPIRPGEVVWLAGRSLVSDLSRVGRASAGSLSQLRREIGRWNRTRRGGFSWTMGSRSRFAQLVEQPLVDVTALLQNALFDRQELSHGDADAYFAVFRGIVQDDDLEHLITRALYYRERRDDQRMLTVARRAVNAEVVSNQDDFLDALERRVNRLSAARLADMTSSRLVAPTANQELLALLQMMANDKLASAHHADRSSITIRRAHGLGRDFSEAATAMRHSWVPATTNVPSEAAHS